MSPIDEKRDDGLSEQWNRLVGNVVEAGEELVDQFMNNETATVFAMARQLSVTVDRMHDRFRRAASCRDSDPGLCERGGPGSGLARRALARR